MTEKKPTCSSSPPPIRVWHVLSRVAHTLILMYATCPGSFADFVYPPFAQSDTIFRLLCRLYLHRIRGNGSIELMTDKQAVIDALQRLPEDASLEEISEELRIMAAIRRGRADVAAGRTKSHADAGQLLESWASAWNSK
jgi:predicted transcriptional regulator